jgi:PD-(D/E)XK nuclease superfamily protein
MPDISDMTGGVMSELPVFSPTSSEAWSTCPVYWRESYRGGWRSRVATKADVSRVMGVGFGHGMALYNLGKMEWREHGTVHEYIASLPTPVQIVQQELDRLVLAGVDCSVFAEMGDLEETLIGSINYATAHDPTPQDWTVIEVEQPHPEAGNARCDVVYQRGDGSRVVRDYKFKLAFEEQKWLAKTLWTYEHTDQVPHYLWMTGAEEFLLTLYKASPKPALVKEEPFRWTFQELEQWKARQQFKWNMMTLHKEAPETAWQSSVHESKYGPCPLADWCLIHRSDPAKRGVAGLVQVERGR